MRDVIIVGGGPAGLSAALILGRCRRRVLLIDSGHPRNAVTPHMHGFLGRDGRPPGDLREEGRRELAAYDTVEIWDGRVADAVVAPDGFQVVMDDQRREKGRRMILATGLRTDLPPIEGFSEFWGHGVHHCPYCDGYENRDRPLAIYGPGEAGKGLALELTAWSRDLTLCTDGPSGFDAPERDRLARNGIRIEERAVARLEGEDGRFARVRLRDGGALAFGALFFVTGPCIPSRLVERLGCDLSRKGTVPTGDYEETNVPGLYVAGDASRRVQLAIVAAAEGAMAAFAINTELLRDDTR
ncbi:NAD(P)/FAD-dependent oxidoreductase [Methylobacterium indicum]|uniref:Thioredoxin reductase n=1 Tax=Methylobacterium indicum TaxID=1775910 RepID=A0ABR5GU72_9HYPH|nr:NAD(P)/FAD-dependent oxidoreductase [Methylobacterium indicum]KMO12455.1 pyridine nucleotide-disulfide oxidoreductase [Methylobacterium indicum]KMO21963.1 pyridine nucleotide-disulfide oxidoreductase [Methylobacterium indicum]